jgi:hypothetical protein
MIKAIPLLLVFCLLSFISGCASSIDITNTQIAAANAAYLKAYADGLAGCRDNSACQVGLTSAFAGGLGRQPLLRPETPLDYIREVRGWIDPIGSIIDRMNGYGGTSGDRSSNIIRGDGNTILVGNKVSSAEQSSTSFSLNPSYTRSYDGGQNRTYTGGETITDDGINTDQEGEI